jgi:hypothetical protein
MKLRKEYSTGFSETIGRGLNSKDALNLMFIGIRSIRSFEDLIRSRRCVTLITKSGTISFRITKERGVS